MIFSQALFDRIKDIYTRILAHPFVEGLTDGSLAPEALNFMLSRMRFICGSFAGLVDSRR